MSSQPTEFFADGKKYVGGIPGYTDPDSPIRSIFTIDPYKDPKGLGITCGPGAAAAKLIAPLTAGSALNVSWTGDDQQAVGPLITYMAKVPEGKTAASVDPVTLDFFKIQQTGQKTEVKSNTNYTVKVPKNITDGEYIIRHEIIALQSAESLGGAEFYPSCFQVNISGGTGTGSPGPTARFPGAYSATDPGILTPGILEEGFKYQFPGPALFSDAS
ncbi:glycoside hydrolase family 61 protein [Ceratobasidium sp. AG-Ba]|nr:glycoside hydrolase family 61 protein [Ceratobasidium sp. AG-Ba]